MSQIRITWIVPTLLLALAVAMTVGCELTTSPLSEPQGEADGNMGQGGGPRARIVVLEPTANAADVAAAYGVQARHLYTHALNGFAGSIAEAARDGLLRDARVVAVVEDEEVTTDGGVQQDPTWGLDRIDQRMLPLDKAYSYVASGIGVTAYIIDSGIRFDHVDFEGRAVQGHDVLSDGQNGADCNGHGTHVAGTVGGRTWGVAKDVRLVSVRVINCSGTGTVSGVIAGIDWIIKNNQGPAVATLSLGAAKNETLNKAVRNLIGAGVQVAVAAGNSNADACTRSPSSTLEAVVVGAAGTAHVNQRQTFSNWGDCVDVFAPGSAIVSASHQDATSSVIKSGTSMAAPHAAGVMALWLEENPALTPAQLHQLIVANATQGIVEDAKSANAHMLYSLREGSAPPPPPTEGGESLPTADFSAGCSELACSFDGSASASSGGSITGYEWSFGDGSTGTGKTSSRTYAAAGTYTVTLTVTDSKGGQASKSASVTASAPPQPLVAPAGPSDLSATLRALNRVDLTWADNSGNEEGFEIQRRTADGQYALLVRLGPNTTSFSDTSIAEGWTYSYRVHAFNAAGASSHSNEVTLTAACLTRGKSMNCR
jgi:subtilisin family serine protease